MSRRNTNQKNVPNESQSQRQNSTRQRIAAENELLDQLRSLLPIPEDTKPDKLSILRLVIAYMKNRHDLSDVIESSERLSLADSIEDSDEDLEKEVDSTSNSKERATLKDLASSVDITLPDTLVSHIEKQLSSRDGFKDKEVLDEKVLQYKEGLERGMNDFLQQNLPMGSIQLDKNNILPGQVAVRKMSSNKRRKSLTKQEKYELPKEGEQALEALDGFVMILTPELIVNYVSSNITRYLGHCPFSVIGQNIELFLHPKDAKNLQQFRDEIMREKDDKTKEELGPRATFYMAMRFCFQTALTRLKSTGFSTIKWDISSRYRCDAKTGISKLASFVCICQLHCANSVKEIKLGGTMYVSRHDTDYKFKFCEPNVMYLTGYSPQELLQAGLFLIQCTCFGKVGEKPDPYISDYYRFLTRDGKWLWMQSMMQTIYNSKGEVQFIESRNYVRRHKEVLQSLHDSLMDKKKKKKASRQSQPVSLSKTKVSNSTDVNDATVNRSMNNYKQRHFDMVVPFSGVPNMACPHDEIPLCKSVLSILKEITNVQHSSDSPPTPGRVRELKEDILREGNLGIFEILDPFADVQDFLPDCEFDQFDLNPFQDVDAIDLLQNPIVLDTLHTTVQDTLTKIPLPEYDDFNSTNYNDFSELQVLTQMPISDPSSSPQPGLKDGGNSMLLMEIALRTEPGIFGSPVTQTIGHLDESYRESNRETNGLPQDLTPQELTLTKIPLPEYDDFKSPNYNDFSDLQALTQMPISDPSPFLQPGLKDGGNSTLLMEIALRTEPGIFGSPVTQTIGHLDESHPETNRENNGLPQKLSRSIESHGNLFPAMDQNDTWNTEGTTVIAASYVEKQSIPSFCDERILTPGDVERNEVTTTGSQNFEIIDSTEFLDSLDSPSILSISSLNNQPDSGKSSPFLEISSSSQLTLFDQDDSSDSRTDKISDIPPDLTDLDMAQCYRFTSSSFPLTH